jgi:hypothetical protein
VGSAANVVDGTSRSGRKFTSGTLQKIAHLLDGAQVNPVRTPAH